MSLKHTDVFVLGGGPAGLAAAIAARRKGLRVTVADCAQPPIDKACGEGLMPDALAVLAVLGVTIAREESAPFRGIRFLGGGASVEADFPSGPGLAVRRTVLHQAMMERAAELGVAMHWGERVRGIGERHVQLASGTFECEWIVGADGGSSAVRRWAGLDSGVREARRFGFRRHYRVAPWSRHMELYWGPECQVYVSAVASDQVCVAAISNSSSVRVENALEHFPELQARLGSAAPVTDERGAVSATRRLPRVYRGHLALVGDASGSVDAITGDGLYLAFQQALALADAMEAGDLARYQASHSALRRRPAFMAQLMLLMGRHDALRRRVLEALAARSGVFSKLLAVHVGDLPPAALFPTGVSLGWQILTQ